MITSLNALRSQAASIASANDPSGGQVDAFRHAYASAILTSIHGDGVARSAGDLVERVRGMTGSNPELVRDMDITNKDLGRNIGDSLRGRDRQAIIDEVVRTISDGRAVIDYQRDVLTLPEGLPVDLHPTRGLPGTMEIEGWPSPSAQSVPASGVNDPWQTARTPPRRDPLALDLDGDGIETVGANGDGGPPALFDHEREMITLGPRSRAQLRPATQWRNAVNPWGVPHG